jgi:hypothetical protein
MHTRNVEQEVVSHSVDESVFQNQRFGYEVVNVYWDCPVVVDN